MIEKITKQIEDNQEEILSNLDHESIAVYSFIKNEYTRGKILENYVFQFIFRKYYGMDNAGLSDDIKKHFFQLLAAKQANLEVILSDLYDIPRRNGDNSIQFSFATKLLHTIDNEKPIFDKEIQSLTFSKPTIRGKQNQIQAYLELYNDLEKLKVDLLKNEKIKNVICKFRLKFQDNSEQITDVKALDFIMWSLGKINEKRKKEKKH